MRYLYYPGCSLKGTGRAYEESLLSVFEELRFPVEELGDWNCCGATAYMSVDEMKAFALAARNLALAEQAVQREPVSLIAPCNACYLVLAKVQRSMAQYPHIGRAIADALVEAGLSYHGDVHVRHPLDVMINDIGLDIIAKHISRPLTGLKVACYYGCQVVRPFATFDDQYIPTSMDQLMECVGATPVDWPLKTRCCGSSLTGTIQEAGLRLSYIILKEARDRGADAVATCCPLCQFNLECYQRRMRRAFDDDIDIPVAYFPQFMGKAMGLEDHRLGLQRLFVPLTSAPALV